MRKLTIKQELFIKEYLNTRNGTEAAFRIYNCANRNIASQIAFENLRKPEILNWVRNNFIANGLTIESIIKNLINLVTKTEVTNIKASDSIKANELLLKMSGYI